MLFANLCVLFLMVLVSGHTISKRFTNEDEIDDLSDSLNDVDFKKQHKRKHDIFFHGYRRDNSYEVTNSLQNVKATEANKMNTKGTSKKADTKLKHKSSNSKFSIWKKFGKKVKKKDKGEQSKKQQGRERLRRLNKYITTPLDNPLTTNERKYFDYNENFNVRDKKSISKKRRKNNNQFVLKKKKRNVEDTELNLTDVRENLSKKEIRIMPFSEYYKSTSGHHFKTVTIESFEPRRSDDDFTNSLDSITSKINHLNFLYGRNSIYYQTNATIRSNNFKQAISIEPTTESLEYLNTFQLEALLNDTKVKAVQMVVEKNPALIDLIMNTVTETTFAADPLLKYIETKSPGSDLVSLKTVSKLYDAKAKDSTEMIINTTPNDLVASNTVTHNIEARSISEDARAKAHSLQVKLQKELKDAFATCKSKICSKICPGSKTPKPAPTKAADKFTSSKPLTTDKSLPFTDSEKNRNYVSLLRTNPGKIQEKNVKSKDKTPTASTIGDFDTLTVHGATGQRHGMNKNPQVKTLTASTNNDYDMLTICEQMLAKSNEKNFMSTLVTTQRIMRKKKEPFRLSKRNSETLTDLSLRENIQKIYNDGEEMPEESIDYEGGGDSKSTQRVTSPDEASSQSFEEEENDQTTSENSFEGLSSKICFKDYVNGYKHYLNFQKELGEEEEHFSDLIRYQAHVHHKVDDIGKFILNKIPQVPITESWLQKHFMSIKTEPHKKYHTSQNMSLKTPVTETNNKVDANIESIIDRPVMEKKSVTTESPNVNWNEKIEDFIHIPYYRTSTINYMQPMTKDAEEKSKKIKNDNKYLQTANQNNELELLNEDIERYKRNAKSHDRPKLQSEKSSTIHAMSNISKKTNMKSGKYGYVDVNLINTSAAKTNDRKLKKSKIRNFFDKFRSKKNKKIESKKTKRNSQMRIERFNPFHGLKNIFKIQTKTTTIQSNKNGATSKIPSKTHNENKFKTPQRFEEMSITTPNTAHDISTEIPFKDYEPIKFKNPQTFEGYPNMIPNVVHDISTQIPFKTDYEPTKFKNPQIFEEMPNFAHDVPNRINMKPGASDVLSAPKSSHLKNPDYKIKNNPHLSKGSKSNATRLNNKAHNYISKHNEKPSKNHKQTHNKDKILYLATKPSETNVDLDDTLLENITLNAIHHDINEMQLLLHVKGKSTANFMNPNLYEKKETTPYLSTRKKVKSKPVTINIKPKAMKMLASNPTEESGDASNVLTDLKSKVKNVPDYFNDLLMWHGDILNADRVNNPSLDEILKSIKLETDKSTPSLTDLQKDLLFVHYNKKNKASTTVSPRTRNKQSSNNVDIFKENFDGATPDKKCHCFTFRNVLHHYLKKNDGKNDDSRYRPTAIIVSSIPFLNDINHDTDRPRYKKKLKSSLKNNTKSDGQKFLHVDKSITNKQPLQYYTTPLPMNVNDFDNFLKNNNIDVESVTSPLKDLPTFTGTSPADKNIGLKKYYMDDSITGHKETTNKNSKPRIDAINIFDEKNKRNPKLSNSEILTDLDPENEIEYLDHLSDTMDNDYNFIEKKRRRRYKASNDYFEKDKTRNAMSFFTKSGTSTLNDEQNLHDLINNDKMYPPMEITIINLDDDKESQSIINIPEEQTEYRSVFSDGDTSQDSAQQYISNELNGIFAKTNPNTSTKNPFRLYKNNCNRNDAPNAATMDDTSNRYKVTEKLHLMQPHRVQNRNNRINDQFYKDYSLNSYVKKKDILSLPFLHSTTNSAQNNPTAVNTDNSEIYRIKTNRNINKIENPNELIYVDLPTYYMPNTDDKMYSVATEKMCTAYVRSLFGGKVKDNVLVSSDKNFNADKVFRDELSFEKKIERSKKRNNRKLRRSRGANTRRESKSNLNTKTIGSENSTPINMDEKQESPKKKFRILSLIQKKLNMLANLHNTTKLGKLNNTEPIPKPTTKRTSQSAMQTASPKDNETNFENLIVMENSTPVTTIFNADLHTTEPTKNQIITTSKTEAMLKPDEDEARYAETRGYKDSISQTHSTSQSLSTKITNRLDENESITDMKLDKRDITIPTMIHYTARDVAALEVIVDMAKNTPYVEETKQHFDTINDQPSTYDKVNNVTNSIQVHIAIPSDYQNNKRSAGPVAIRKVFSAKLSSPVDLEYQVSSFEHFTETTPTEGLTPGIYLIVSNDSSVFNGQFALKPIRGSVDLNQILGKQIANVTENYKETSVANFPKVTLSKDFISAVNKHLVQLFDNFSKNGPSTHKVKVRRDAEEHHLFSFNAIKKFFGHDRVCDCKCKANKTMCRGCAASDAVISELIFEFENLAQYMSDHCTEIQTFFWMNPSGGKQLKDAVHKIDSKLKDYYKSVKNKCKGPTCKAIMNPIDKRGVNALNNDTKYIGWPMVKDLHHIADILKNATKSNICYDKSIKNKGEKLLGAFNSCISDKQLNKRDNNNDRSTQTSFKNVYSLDNVNINIICNREPTTEFTADVSNKHGYYDPIFDYTIDGYTEHKRSGFRKLFGSKKRKYKSFLKTDELLKEFEMTTAKLIVKREANRNQIETPLIADTGGTFWHDYIKSTIEPSIIRETKILNPKPTINESDKHTSTTESMKDELFKTTMGTSKAAKLIILRSDNTTGTKHPTTVDDYLNTHIHGLLKLVGGYADVDDIKQIYTEDVPTSPSVISKHRHKIKKAKNKKNKKTSLHDNKFKVTKDNTATSSDRKLKKKIIKNLVAKLASTKTPSLSKKSYSDKDTHNLFLIMPASVSTNIVNTKANTQVTTKCIQLETERNNIGEIKKADADSKNEIKDKGITSETTKTTKEIHNFRRTIPLNKSILILNEYDDINDRHVATENYMNIDVFKDLLLSIIQYKTNKLNDEWVKVANKGMFERNTLDDIVDTLKQNFFLDVTSSSKLLTSQETVPYMKPNTSTKPSINTRNASKHSDITENPKSIRNTNKANIIQKGSKRFLNKILNKLSSMVTPGTNKNLMAVTKEEQVKIPEENESSTDVNSYVNRLLGHTISGLKTGQTQETKKTIINLADLNKELRKGTSKEACNTHWNPIILCDVCVTHNHMLNQYQRLHHRAFENQLKNITCFKYKEASQYFIINPKRNEDEPVTVVSKSKEWDWVRNKRSANLDYKDIHKAERKNAKVCLLDSEDVKRRAKKNTIEYDDFDTYKRDKYGIYRLEKMRRKRTVDAKRFTELKNSPLIPTQNVLYAMPGDSISLDCVTSEDSSKTTNHVSCSNMDMIIWDGDTEDILKQDNVVVDGATLFIKNIQPRNSGHYFCRKGNRVQRSIRLSVITLPSFILVLLPTYSSNSDCTYDDLNALQYLGAEVSKVACCDEHCAVTIEDPVCLKDELTGQVKVRAAIVIKVDPHPGVDCSVECQRDIHSSLAKLHADNAPILNNIGVVLINEGGNKTFTPSRVVGKLIITHRLRIKDTKKSQAYQKMISKMISDDVFIVESCPAGYYLVPEQIICATCPQNTSSVEGDNACSACPQGTWSRSGADRCQLVMPRLRRYDWWWYPPCGYCVACGGVVCACGACVALALLVHVTSRGRQCAPSTGGDGKQGRREYRSARAHVARACPLSPSRVILTRFFKPSLSSARVTDSQEMKFEQWKERNIPPPLPPIDFDF